MRLLYLGAVLASTWLPIRPGVWLREAPMATSGRGRRGHVRLAFQSYPALLVGDGRVPWELEAPGRGVDLDHRDSRLALCMDGTGSVIVVLTRFAGFGGTGETLPWGPTVPEMATYMRSLGCRRSVLLDGGVSGQLAVRNENGSVRRWPNWRSVPLALVATPEDRRTR